MTSLRDLPFEQTPPLALFGLDRDGDVPVDHEHTRYGWCVLPGVELVGEDQALWVESPLVLALHSPDEDEIAVPRRGGVPSDINLEFTLSPEDSAIALLSEFLGTRVPAIVGDARTIVLALCNPRRARISKPPALAGRRLYYGTGDVVAWLRRRPHATDWSLAGDAFVQLESARWHSC
ncbi:hypothetical protein [Nannocystis punicea]|uniref:Uncharacterized protein n=1 Tax=Nannocystis punicea TaxID=2995304 RepID=A0ABY7H3H9_9BACT|nr:hypothetical protein [Nannocystis poenicansa]WAS93757.1 hypothetical protein O0S08_47090 [Nannocystis poenicansa]